MESAGMMQKVMVSVSDDLMKALEQEQNARKTETLAETFRSVVGGILQGQGKLVAHVRR